MDSEGISNDKEPLRRKSQRNGIKTGSSGEKRHTGNAIQIESPVILFQICSSKSPAHEIHSHLLELKWDTHLHNASLTKLRLEVLAAAEALQLSVHHDADASAKRVCFFHAMRCQNNGARIHRFRYNAPHKAAACWVHARRWFVQIHNFGVAEQSNGHAKLSLIAATEITGKLVRIVLQAHFLEHGVHFQGQVVTGVSFNPAVGLQVLSRCYIGPERVELRIVSAKRKEREIGRQHLGAITHDFEGFARLLVHVDKVHVAAKKKFFKVLKSATASGMLLSGG
jgi:hypothetical protein